MKQFLLATAICLLATVTVKAQPTSNINIDLTALSCDVMVEIMGVTPASTTCPGTLASTSGLMWLAPGMYNFDNTVLLPGSFAMNDLFAYVRVYEDDHTIAVHCIGAGWQYDVGACANTSVGPVDLGYNLTSGCQCTSNNVTITWDQPSMTLTIM